MSESIAFLPLDRKSIDSIEWIWKRYHIKPISCVSYQNYDWFLERRQIFDTFFLLITKGCLHVELDDDCFEVPAGSMLMLPDSEYHQIRSQPQQSDLHQIAIHALINNQHGDSLLNRAAIHHMKIPHFHYWKKSFLNTSSLLKISREAGLQQLTQQLHLLLNECIINGLEINLQESSDSRIDHALSLISNKLNHDWTVSELAKETGLGVVQFRKLFNKHTQCTPKKYIYQKRIQESCRLLQFTDAPIKQIACDIGFNSDYYYQRLFKQHMQCTPSEYRRQSHL